MHAFLHKYLLQPYFWHVDGRVAPFCLLPQSSLAPLPQFIIPTASSLPRRILAIGMNPEVFEDGERLVVARAKRAGTRLHRRLQESISESRMLQVLDRSLEIDRSAPSLKTPSTTRSLLGLSNQNQDEEEEEEELVCVSTMVAVESEAVQEEPQQRVRDSAHKLVDAMMDLIVMLRGFAQVCGVLKTVRHISRERSGVGSGRQRENQSESAEGFK